MEMKISTQCPIWGTNAFTTEWSSDDSYIMSARAGGTYSISKIAEVTIKEVSDKQKSRLTTWLVNQHRFGVSYPKITSDLIEEAKLYPSLSVSERLDRLLRLLDSHSSGVGEEITLAFHDDTHVETRHSECREALSIHMLLAHTETLNRNEVKYLLKCLEKLSWIELPLNWIELSDFLDAQISHQGYARLAELGEKAVNSKQAFIAMWFAPSMDEAYENGIKKGVEDAGYEPIRIDRKDHNNKIDDQIIAEIRRSRFAVADFTQGKKGARGGVYYEAGFAHGLNIPVIFTCRADAVEMVHFNTRQYNHIAWKNPEELRKCLAQRIAATIGDGPQKKNS